MPRDDRESGPAVENRWWVDTGKTRDSPRSHAGGQSRVGSKFFEVAQDFDQERARARLTDTNLQIFDEARPAVGEWRVVHTVSNERFPAPELDRIRSRLPLPPGARGVIVDSGRSARFIVTGDPVGERILEFTLGEEPSFDCWIRGDWVREEVFGSVDDALRRARPYLERFLESQPEPW
jgi:hypothetical protein